MADKAASRKRAEAAALAARAEAKKHLESTGTGQSQYEIKGVHRQVGYDIDMGDNTLQVVCQKRKHEESGQLLVQMAIPPANKPKTASVKQSKESTSVKNDLKPGWKIAVDKISGDVYYWNKTTKETTWEKPSIVSSLLIDNSADKIPRQHPPPAKDVLPDGWEEAQDPYSADVYYWNIHTLKTQWERPVSLEQAIQAKSKLDQLLDSCGSNALFQDTSEDAQDAQCKLTCRDKPVILPYFLAL
ncbi:hypothetical protein Ae201684_006240 [Aphanomyces euteiches]|uniref:WW domain-containing protein n=1 Tax=Aphanomyces euteiches TaxID=100861 RepID=A0A6G0XCK0_9STRA|nr:hypothetical protein Ae201684_006240 [Aphanomyces euteiches]KAH9155630.1 hypothetical protein AeRB84_002414 [Aphanomyces euteiches]